MNCEIVNGDVSGVDLLKKSFFWKKKTKAKRGNLKKEDIYICLFRFVWFYTSRKGGSSTWTHLKTRSKEPISIEWSCQKGTIVLLNCWHKGQCVKRRKCGVLCGWNVCSYILPDVALWVKNRLRTMVQETHHTLYMATVC